MVNDDDSNVGKDCRLQRGTQVTVKQTAVN